MAFGMEALAPKLDLLCVGQMGVGATTVAVAIDHALYGGDAEDWVGRGASVDDARLRRKADAVRAAVARHREHLSDPLEVLRRLGGREIAAMAGATLAVGIVKCAVACHDGIATFAEAGVVGKD
jgi:nicotinate-nucleotide--dimethylbenzimidazole phosphoribosyltransferase